MFKITAALMLTTLMLASQPVMAAARVAVAHFAPFADTLDGEAAESYTASQLTRPFPCVDAL